MKKKAISKSAYWEKLKDPRWQKKRLEVLDRSNFECELCGDKESTLHVHHVAYRKGAEPWEYDSFDELQCLCESCHANEHDVDRKLEEALFEFKTTAAMCGHSKDILIGFLQAATFGNGPWKEDLEIFSDEQAEGIAKYYGLNASAFNDIVELSLSNNNILNYRAFFWKFHEKINREYYTRIANEDPKKFMELFNHGYLGYEYWPVGFEEEILLILKEKHGLTIQINQAQ